MPPEKPFTDFDLDRFLPYRLTRAALRTSEALAKQYRARFGISIAEWRILVNLADAGTVSVKDIEIRVSMPKYEVSRAAKRLESVGLITKSINREDRRLVDISLTEQGFALMTEALPMAMAFQADIEARLGSSLDALQTALDVLLSDAEPTGDDDPAAREAV